MDKKPADGRRVHFSIIATSTPKLIVGPGNRHALVFSNESSSVAMRIGHSGTVGTLGLYIPANQGFTDNYSSDEYWVVAASSSGTVSGFLVL